MRVGIDLNNRHEADAVARAMDDPLTKAVTVITGMLLALDTIAQRRAVISVVATLTGFNGKPGDPSAFRLHDGSDTDE